MSCRKAIVVITGRAHCFHDCNNYIVKWQTVAVDKGYYWYIRKKESRIKVLNFTASFVKLHAIEKSCNSVTFFANFFLLMCWYIKVKVLFFFKMNSEQILSFNSSNSLLWGYCSFRCWLLLALKLKIRVIRRGDMVRIKLV